MSDMLLLGAFLNALTFVGVIVTCNYVYRLVKWARARRRLARASRATS